MSEERPDAWKKMPNRPDRPDRPDRPKRMRQAGVSVAAADFKARCLELMDRVRETGAEYTITKHGRPVARLVPCKPALKPRRLFGSMKGTVLAFDRPTDPIDGGYDINRD